MIKLDIIKQKYDYDCGPASLAMVFCYNNTCQEYPDLLKMAGAKRGTDNLRMKELAEEIGFKTKMKENAEIEDIKKFIEKKIPVIVNYIEPTMNIGHYSVVVGINEKLILANTDNGEEEEWDIKKFEERWVSGDGKHKRWMLAVFK